MPVAPISHRSPPRRSSGRLSRRAGQATTEWMLLLSVIVLAVVAAGYVLATEFGAGMEDLAGGAGNVYTSGDLGQ